jgi:adenine-specific DNA-methyltransferase
VGIKFNSNFQWSTTSRDVKDGNVEHITREPEQVKAFRDTWRDGIHSYLTYLRDRLTVTRDLLTDSGSIFVQIGDENVHHVRMLMDEVFGDESFVSAITFTKAEGLSAKSFSNVTDFILWYAKRKETMKWRDLKSEKKAGQSGATGYVLLENEEKTLWRTATSEEIDAGEVPGYVFFDDQPLVSQDELEGAIDPFVFQGHPYRPAKGRHWTTGKELSKLERVARANRIIQRGNRIEWKRYINEVAGTPVNNVWIGMGDRGFAGTEKTYIVQTAPEVIRRCLLMATDPGDLVLDPTCGSGTTAYVAEQWGRRWITIDTSRVALALARARIMGARYPYYLLADSPEGQLKEAEITCSAPSSQPTRGDIRQGFVYERRPHITLGEIANNAEIDEIWEQWQTRLEPLREALNKELQKSWQEWEIPREADTRWSAKAKQLHADWWQTRIARQKEIDASIAAKAEFEYLYDKPYDDKKRMRVAGPFTVESLSPHRVLGVDEDDELIDSIAESPDGYSEEQGFVPMILEHLKTAGVQQAHKEDKITFTSLTPWPGDLVCAEGRFNSDQWPVASGQKEQLQATSHKSLATAGPLTTELRAAIFIGPEFGTLSRPDLVSAAREAGDADFDVLIACAFNYDAHSSEFDKLGRIPILKARMNADLHMAGDLKNTGKGNLFVIFGEPDIEVTSGQWLVARNGRLIANYEHVKQLSGLGSLEEINRLGGDDLSSLRSISTGRKIWSNQPNQESGYIDLCQHRGGGSEAGDGGISALSGDRERLASRDGNLRHSGGKAADVDSTTNAFTPRAIGRHWSNAQRTQTLAALEALTAADFPLSLTTDHKSQVTVYGVDVFHPQTGEVRSDGPEGIACWFIDTDYNEESFFVRHAYFLGANDPYKSLKITLKAEINEDAWATLNSDISRPFDKPRSGRIAVKVINHLGDEVMKVFKVRERS